MYTLSKSYDTITPESAFQGDYAESGFVYEDERFESLQDMADEILREGNIEIGGDCPDVWFTTGDCEIDYMDSSQTFFGFHPKGLTQPEMTYLKKLLGFQVIIPSPEKRKIERNGNLITIDFKRRA